MSGLVRIIALALMLLPLPYICGALVSRSKKRAVALSDVCRFLDYAQREIRQRLTPLPELLADFLRNNSISDCVAGILRDENRSAAADYSILCREDTDRLRRLILSLGKDSAEVELRRIDEARSYFLQRSQMAEKDCEKDCKVYPLLMLGIGAGLFLLII